MLLSDVISHIEPLSVFRLIAFIVWIVNGSIFIINPHLSMAEIVVDIVIFSVIIIKTFSKLTEGVSTKIGLLLYGDVLPVFVSLLSGDGIIVRIRVKSNLLFAFKIIISHETGTIYEYCGVVVIFKHPESGRNSTLTVLPSQVIERLINKECN